MPDYRALNASEIQRLQENGCTCEDWTQISVAPHFNPARISNSHFSGQIRLGTFEKTVTFFGGIQKPTGIYNARIHNCEIGDNVFIDQIRNYIANYKIASDVVIENVDVLAVEGKSSFGNGTEIAVLNEAGGREIPVFDLLSAHIGYFLALYRHRTKVIENLYRIIENYRKSISSPMGSVASGARLINCRVIKNVRIGEKATIEGVNRLENGSINSSAKDPVYVGPGVIAEDFIVCSGSKISDGSLIAKCFVGQGCELGKHYSAENSAFFANCAGFHGEACSIFAGPYTVTHHKSTLLIAGYFSFLNAGSGSNQSNHMYKLGPLHQGIVERGSKTTSDSYLLWPAQVGAFTVIMGRHYRNADTSDLPFSYLIESEDESILVPGVNLRSVGTVRDARKWPKRDRRKDSKKLDYINFNLLSPYTIQKMLNGIEILRNLLKASGENSEFFYYHNVKIKKGSLIRGINFYRIGINKFLGNSLIKRLEKRKFAGNKEIQDRLCPDTELGKGKWVDVAGLIAPLQVVEGLLQDIENEKIDSIEKLDAAFRSIHENYYTYEWTWAIDILQKQLGKKIEQITVHDVINMVNAWRESVVKLDRMLAEDAKKEFSTTACTGFGMDFGSEEQKADFENVRGTFEEDSFVREIENHIVKKTRLGDELVARLEKYCVDIANHSGDSV